MSARLLVASANSIMSAPQGFTARLYGINSHEFAAVRQGSRGTIDRDRLSVEKFAVGQSVPRKEDPMLLRARGTIPTTSPAGQAYAVMVRSQNAHASSVRSTPRRREKCRA